MERVWVFETLAITVATVDFLDPASADEPDARERGVRVEVRPLAWDSSGSVYASPTLTMRPAVCRVDLLESRPGAADRMHWHPVMDAGEPGDRVLDLDMPADPVGWLAARLRRIEELLAGAGASELHRVDVAAVAGASDQITAAVRDALAWAREPWPDVLHDERGMAPA